MFRQVLTAVQTLLVLAFCFGNEAPAENVPEAVTVEVDGLGANADSAEKNALYQAVEQAVGAFLTAEMRIENQEVIQNRILTVAQGFIQSYTRITPARERRDGSGLWEIRIKAIVKKNEVANALRSAGVNSVGLSGSNAWATQVTRMKNREDALELLSKLIPEIPQNLVLAELLQSPGKIVTREDPSTGDLLAEIRVRYSINWEWWTKQAVPSLSAAFSALSFADPQSFENPSRNVHIPFIGQFSLAAPLEFNDHFTRTFIYTGNYYFNQLTDQNSRKSIQRERAIDYSKKSAEQRKLIESQFETDREDYEKKVFSELFYRRQLISQPSANRYRDYHYYDWNRETPRMEPGRPGYVSLETATPKRNSSSSEVTRIFRFFSIPGSACTSINRFKQLSTGNTNRTNRGETRLLKEQGETFKIPKLDSVETIHRFDNDFVPQAIQIVFLDEENKEILKWTTKGSPNLTMFAEKVFSLDFVPGLYLPTLQSYSDSRDNGSEDAMFFSICFDYRIPLKEQDFRRLKKIKLEPLFFGVKKGTEK